MRTSAADPRRVFAGFAGAAALVLVTGAASGPGPGGAAVRDGDGPYGPRVWDVLAACESGGNWASDSGNGYYGGLQFSLATWESHGGEQFAPAPHLARREEQIAVARTVREGRDGYGAWPRCARKLGLPR